MSKNDNDINKELRKLLEKSSNNPTTRILALAILETRKDLQYLKLLNKAQLYIILSILIAIIGLISTVISKV